MVDGVHAFTAGAVCIMLLRVVVLISDVNEYYYMDSKDLILAQHSYSERLDKYGPRTPLTAHLLVQCWLCKIRVAKVQEH